MPTTDAARPSRLAGTRASGARLATPIQQPMPSTMDSSAPWVVARFQYAPATSGTKAPASVTL